MAHDDTPVGDADATAELVRRAGAGDDRAFGALYDAWFDRVYDRAYGVVRDHSLAAEVAQDAFVRAWQRLDTVRDPAVFGGWLLQIARNTALNRLRSERRTTAVDDVGLAMIERNATASATAPVGFGIEDRLTRADDPETAVEDDELVALVTEAASALEGRDAEVLDLGLRYGLTPAEIGEAVGLNRNAANQAVHRARRRLRTAVEARVLWRRGRPECPDLAAALAEAGVERFGAQAVAVTEAHVAHCDVCTERRSLRLDPAVLFGAAPLVLAPSLLKTQIARALAEQGIPMGGSSHAGGTSASGDGGDGSHGADDSYGADGSHGASGGDAGGPASADGAPTVDTATPETDATAVESIEGAAPANEPANEPASDAATDPTTTAAIVPEPSEPPTTARSSGRRRLALVAGGIVALVIITGGVVALASGSDDPEPRSSAAPATRADRVLTPTTSTPATTTPATTTPSETTPGAVDTPPDNGPTGDTAPTPTAPPRVVPPPTAPPETTPPPPPPPTVAITGSISVTPGTKAGGTYPMTPIDAPRLAWSSANAGSVSVEGPGVSSNAANGSVLVCPPGGASGQVCPTPPPGTYRWRLTLRDANGAVVHTQDATLVIT